MKPSPRRKARELAVQATYSWQVSQNPVKDIEVNFIAENSKRRFDIEYFQLLLPIGQLLRDITIRRQKFERVDLRQNLIMNDLVFLVIHRIQ